VASLATAGGEDGGEKRSIPGPAPLASTATPRPPAGRLRAKLGKLPRVARKLFSFLGPGAVISVAYVDPDNYQTAISAGASFEYKLLFMILVSNLIAIYLQVRRVPGGTRGAGSSRLTMCHI